MCRFPYLKHRWFDVPGEEKKPLIFSGVYLLFGRPIGIAKMQYCERCGALRLVPGNAKDSESKSK